MLDSFKDFVARLLNIYRAPVICKGCIAHIEHIESLESLIRRQDQLIEFLNSQLEHYRESNFEIIKHITGMNRASLANTSSEMHSIKRPNNSVASRIARAEAADREEAKELNLSASRRKDYNDRINSLLKSDEPQAVNQDTSIKVVGDLEDAVQEDRAEQIQESERAEVH